MEANQEACFSSLRLIVLLGSWADVSEPPSIPDSLCSSWLLAHCFPYLCLSPSALLDSSAGQGGGGHKTGEEPREDVADPKGNEFLRETLDDKDATNRTFARPSPSV